VKSGHLFREDNQWVKPKGDWLCQPVPVQRGNLFGEFNLARSSMCPPFAVFTVLRRKQGWVGSCAFKRVGADKDN
jgi:hypothetical protein